ncbi:hypothetical protein HPB48_021081 [Haemaphysalis longicornis]|uniref:Ig-like domain-containing protein n=1 Tax=Haemaphysalis longicornis TaxID=44386 RepID=A0A9J6H2P8_HAELO|nr:hypothetical protein HPB48_021081 [Haemaphysalis longicornis]
MNGSRRTRTKPQIPPLVQWLFITASLAANGAGEVPKVNPFTFVGPLSEGQSTAVNCMITEGSKPVQLQWLKDGREVTSSGAVKLIKHETIVVLSIEPVTVADSGNYTCVARNKYGLDRYTSTLHVNGVELKSPSEDRVQALQNGTLVIRDHDEWRQREILLPGIQRRRHCSDENGVLTSQETKTHRIHGSSRSCLFSRSQKLTAANTRAKPATDIGGRLTKTVSVFVREPPQWIDEPRDVSATEGTEVQLRCSAVGRPRPTVTWSRCVPGGKPSVVCGDSGAPVPVRSSNGSVTFAHVAKENEGRYACFVDNGVGKPLRKAIRLDVNVRRIMVAHRSQGAKMRMARRKQKRKRQGSRQGGRQSRRHPKKRSRGSGSEWGHAAAGDQYYSPALPPLLFPARPLDGEEKPGWQEGGTGRTPRGI